MWVAVEAMSDSTDNSVSNNEASKQDRGSPLRPGATEFQPSQTKVGASKTSPPSLQSRAPAFENCAEVMHICLSWFIAAFQGHQSNIVSAREFERHIPMPLSRSDSQARTVPRIRTQREQDQRQTSENGNSKSYANFLFPASDQYYCPKVAPYWLLHFLCRMPWLSKTKTRLSAYMCIKGSCMGQAPWSHLWNDLDILLLTVAVTSARKRFCIIASGLVTAVRLEHRISHHVGVFYRQVRSKGWREVNLPSLLTWCKACLIKSKDFTGATFQRRLDIKNLLVLQVPTGFRRVPGYETYLWWCILTTGIGLFCSSLAWSGCHDSSHFQDHLCTATPSWKDLSVHPWACTQNGQTLLHQPCYKSNQSSPTFLLVYPWGSYCSLIHLVSVAKVLAIGPQS